MRSEKRPEDMSEAGYLEIEQCEDGDIHVTVREGGYRYDMASIEFTLSGTRSNHTLEALRHLMDAMAKDSAGVPWPDGEHMADTSGTVGRNSG